MPYLGGGVFGQVPPPHTQSIKCNVLRALQQGEKDFSDQLLCFLGLLSYPEILSFYCSFLSTRVFDAFIHGHDSAFHLLKMFT